MEREFLAREFQQGLDYNAYVATGNPEQQRRWRQVLDAAQLTPEQRQLLSGFVREMNLLVVSGIWCGDCVQQVPLIRRLEEANPARIHMRIVDRDERRDLSSRLRLNGGDRVPVVLLLSEDYELCGIHGDRTLHRYRALAAKQLGPACPIGVTAPDQGELAATLADWAGELERIQLMLRLSPRLRQRHGD